MTSAAAKPVKLPEIHDLDHEAFLREVHSFEFWFQAVEGYLSGTVDGHGAATVDEPPVGVERERLVTALCNYCVGEIAALEGASGLIVIAPTQPTKIFLATQVADEGRHLEVLLRRLRDLGVADPEGEVERRVSPSLQLFRRRLLELVSGRDWEAAIFAQNVILESLEYAVFHAHASNADPVTREVLEGVIKDERRHIGFGENELGRRLAGAPHARARLDHVRKELDHLVLDMLETTARDIGVDRQQQERLGRAYRESVGRLGFA
jgi:1,2-phenylacetyl-CoA epoxidase catalytic subunit